MPDITKCTNNKCPLSKSCYRFTSTPNEYRQSYSMFEPKIINDKWECEYFYEQNKKDKK